MTSGNWSLLYTEFIPEEQGVRETLCTLGNGFFATRGAFPEAEADEFHYPGTYLAGGYNRLKSEIAGRLIENEDLVNMPNWLYLRFRIEGGEWFSLSAVEILSFRQELRLDKGILVRRVRFRDFKGRITVLEQERVVHMRDFHLAGMKSTFMAENWSGSLEIVSALDGRVQNRGVERYRALNSLHLIPVEAGVNQEGNLYLKVQTNQSEITVALGVKHLLSCYGGEMASESDVIVEEGFVGQRHRVDLKRGETITHEKIVSLYMSREDAISEPCLEAQNRVADAPGFAQLASTHAYEWECLWKLFDMEIEVEAKRDREPHPLLTLRLHIFHLLQTLSMNILHLDAGVPARGLHGEAYRGHIFWDDLFICPFFNLRYPQITASILKYRYRRLHQARKAAKEEGFKGAMFPWQSGSDGREESQKIHLNPKSGRWIPDNSSLQRHVNIAIAYNVWHYFEATRDIDFLRSYGAEILLDISCFLASLCSWNEELKHYEIHHVMGPDEYHDGYPEAGEAGLSNNTYMNIMTVWVLHRALELVKILPKEEIEKICCTLAIGTDEFALWKEITKKMRVVFLEDGLFSQFEGYENLEELPWKQYEKKYGDIQRLDRILEKEEDTPNRYKVSKQADVLMLFYLLSADELKMIMKELNYSFDTQAIPKNIDYYLERTSHGSTLSRIVHSWVLSRGDREKSWTLFENALRSDVMDIQGGTTKEGIHLGSMAGTVDIMQRCYTGIETSGDVLWFNPLLPKPLKKMSFHLYFHSHPIEVVVTHKLLRITSHDKNAAKITIGFADKKHKLHGGGQLEFFLR